MIKLPDFLFNNQKNSKSSRKVTEFNIESEDRVFQISLRRHKSAKRMILRQDVAHGGFKLTIPERGTIAAAKQFCYQNLTWIENKSLNNQDIVKFQHGKSIPLRGQPYNLIFLSQLRGKTQISDDSITVTGGTEFAPRRLLNFLKAEAKTDIMRAIEKYEPLLNVKHNKVTVRDTTSRWGSCSASKALSFSWRLVMAPSPVLDYVVAHELAHILEMNHSTKFWAHVARVCPDMKQSQTWLKVRGGQLHQFHVK